MGEAIAVGGGGSPPSAQIMFSAIEEVKEGDCALPPEEGEGLQDAAAGHPGEPPPPSTQTFKNLSTTFLFKATTATSACASQGPGVPYFASKASQSIA